MKAKGYEKPAAFLKIKATRELGDSLEIANVVAAQDFDLKAHTSKIANLEKLIQITDTPETKTSLRVELKLLYRGEPARLAVRAELKVSTAEEDDNDIDPAETNKVTKDVGNENEGE